MGHQQSERAALVAQIGSENNRLRAQVERLQRHQKDLTLLHQTAVEGWQDCNDLCNRQAETIQRLREQLAIFSPTMAEAIAPLREADQEGKGHAALCVA